MALLGKPEPQPPAPPEPAPARRFTDALEAHTTLIGPHTRVKGELHAEGPVELLGTLEGDARIAGHCHVRAGARVIGRLEATSLVVEGEIDGSALVAERVEIRASARVSSNIRARLVAIADGAFFEGEVRMDDPTGSGTPLTFTEKRR